MLWLDRLINYAAILLTGNTSDGGTAEKAVEARGRFAPGCVYRGGVENCPPFRANDTEPFAVSYSGDARPCYDINVKVETFYEFIPVTTTTTQTKVSTSVQTSTVRTVQTLQTSTRLSTYFVTVGVTTFTSVPKYSSITVTYVTTFSAIGTTTVFSEVITGSVNIGTSTLTTILTTTPFFTYSQLTFVETTLLTTVTKTSLSTSITTFATDAFAAAITIGPNLKDWSYFQNSCADLTYDGDGSFVGGPILKTNSAGRNPLFISSNKRFRLYPCETAEISGNFTLLYSNIRNITSPLGYQSDPSYGAGLLGGFDLDTGFSFYLIATANRAYAMYSRVPSWCPCVNVTSTSKPCGSCRGLDLADDARFPVPSPVCDPCGDACPVNPDCNPCGCGNGVGDCASALYTMSAKILPSSSPTTSLIGKAAFGAAAAPRRPNMLIAKGGFEYFSFTYLIPIDYLVPGAPIIASILLNKGEPSVTWTVNGKPRLTIRNIGQSIDPRFMLAQYGGSSDYLDFPSSIQLALGLLSVTESTDGRTACQGGVYEECYQGGQSIDDARYTFCNRAAIQDPRTYNLALEMDIRKLGLARISKVPRPCCPAYA